jgi:hypothetical protein
LRLSEHKKITIHGNAENDGTHNQSKDHLLPAKPFHPFAFLNPQSAICNPKLLEVVSKPQIRFKGKAQADRESRCSQHTWVCEHLPEVCNAAIGP